MPERSRYPGDIRYEARCYLAGSVDLRGNLREARDHFDQQISIEHAPAKDMLISSQASLIDMSARSGLASSGSSRPHMRTFTCHLYLLRIERAWESVYESLAIPWNLGKTLVSTAACHSFHYFEAGAIWLAFWHQADSLSVQVHLHSCLETGLIGDPMDAPDGRKLSVRRRLMPYRSC